MEKKYNKSEVDEKNRGKTEVNFEFFYLIVNKFEAGLKHIL